MQYTSQFGEGRMKREEIIELRKEMEKLREGDRIDFDLYCYKLLEIYRIMVSRAKKYVKNAFASCDLVKNQQNIYIYITQSVLDSTRIFYIKKYPMTIIIFFFFNK